MADFKIKKVIKNIYKVNYSNTKLRDGDELIIEDGVSDFVTMFKLYDVNNGIIVSPNGYERGLVYKATGEVVNVPAWFPETVKFNLNFFGLKKNSIYKLTVIGRNTGNNHIVTKNRMLSITNSNNESLMNEDLTNVLQNKEFHTIFRAAGNETTLFFTIGKIAIRDIILDEVELVGDEKTEGNGSESEEVVQDEIEEGKISIVSYGIFLPNLQEHSDMQIYIPLMKYSGKGLVLSLDTKDNSFILERDNREDSVMESFTSARYIVDFNFDKLQNFGFTHYKITEVSGDVSPTTLKPGYIRFKFVDKDGNTATFKPSTGQIYVLIRKIA